jgi:hypothetical protein
MEYLLSPGNRLAGFYIKVCDRDLSHKLKVLMILQPTLKLDASTAFGCDFPQY